MLHDAARFFIFPVIFHSYDIWASNDGVSAKQVERGIKMRTNGAVFEETKIEIFDSFEEAAGNLAPSIEEIRDGMSIMREPVFLYEDGVKIPNIMLEIEYSEDEPTRVIVSEITHEKPGDGEDEQPKSVELGYTKNPDEMHSRIESAVSEIRGADSSYEDFDFVKPSGKDIEDLPDRLESSSRMGNDVSMDELSLGELAHRTLASVFDPSGQDFYDMITGVISPSVFYNMTGESLDENEEVREIRAANPDFGKFFGFDMIGEKPETKTVIDDREKVQLSLNIETYKISPDITARVSVDGKEDSPIRLSVIQGTPLRDENGDVSRDGVGIRTKDVVLHDTNGVIYAVFRPNNLYELFEERGTRIEYLASVSEDTADTDEYKSAVSKGVEQFFGSMSADYEKKADSVQKNIRTNIDTIRELDIKVNKVSLAYDFAAREWSEVKEKASQALSVARGYEKGAEDSKRVEATRELVKMLPEIRGAFERYSYYKTEMVASCKEATLFGRVVQSAGHYSNGRNHIMIPVGKEIGPGKDVDTNRALSFEMFPDEKLLPISHEAVPIGYDEDMEGFVERYNASAGEGEKLEYNPDTHTVTTESGTAVDGRTPISIDYSRTRENVDAALPDNEKLAVRDYSDSAVANATRIDDDIDSEAQKVSGDVFDYQFDNVELSVLDWIADTDPEEIDGMSDEELIGNLNEVIDDARDGDLIDRRDETDIDREGNDDNDDDKSIERSDRDEKSNAEKFENVFHNNFREAADISARHKGEESGYREKLLEHQRTGTVNLDNESRGGIRLDERKIADIKISSTKETREEFRKDRLEGAVKEWEGADKSKLDKVKDKALIDARTKWDTAKAEFRSVETEYREAKKEYESLKDRYDGKPVDERDVSFREVKDAESKFKSAEDKYNKAKDKLDEAKINIRIEQKSDVKAQATLSELKDLFAEIKAKTMQMNVMADKYYTYIRRDTFYLGHNFSRARMIDRYVKMGGAVGRDSVIEHKIRPLEIVSAFRQWTNTNVIKTIFMEAIMDVANSVISHDYEPKESIDKGLETTPDKDGADNDKDRVDAGRREDAPVTRDTPQPVARENVYGDVDAERRSALNENSRLSKDGAGDFVFSGKNGGNTIIREEKQFASGYGKFIEKEIGSRGGVFRTASGITYPGGPTRVTIETKTPKGVRTDYVLKRTLPNGSVVGYRVGLNPVDKTADWKAPGRPSSVVTRDGQVIRINTPKGERNIERFDKDGKKIDTIKITYGKNKTTIEGKDKIEILRSDKKISAVVKDGKKIDISKNYIGRGRVEYVINRPDGITSKIEKIKSGDIQRLTVVKEDRPKADVKSVVDVTRRAGKEVERFEGTREYIRDKDGNLERAKETLTDKISGKRVEREFDKDERITKEKYFDKDGSPLIERKYKYDDQKNVTVYDSVDGETFRSVRTYLTSGKICEKIGDKFFNYTGLSQFIDKSSLKGELLSEKVHGLLERFYSALTGVDTERKKDDVDKAKTDAQAASDDNNDVDSEPKDGADDEPKDNVDGEPKDGADDEPKDNVDGEPKDGADDEPKDNVEGEPKDGADDEPKDNVEGEPKDGADDEPKDNVDNEEEEEDNTDNDEDSADEEGGGEESVDEEGEEEEDEVDKEADEEDSVDSSNEDTPPEDFESGDTDNGSEQNVTADGGELESGNSEDVINESGSEPDVESNPSEIIEPLDGSLEEAPSEAESAVTEEPSEVVDSEGGAEEVGGGETTAEDVTDSRLTTADAEPPVPESVEGGNDAADVAPEVGADSQMTAEEESTGDKSDTMSDNNPDFQMVSSNNIDIQDPQVSELKSDNLEYSKSTLDLLESGNLDFTDPSVYTPESMADVTMAEVPQQMSFWEAFFKFMGGEVSNAGDYVDAMTDGLSDLANGTPDADIDKTPIENFLDTSGDAFDNFKNGAIDKFETFKNDIGFKEGEESFPEYLKNRIFGSNDGVDTGVDAGTVNDNTGIDMNENPVPNDPVYEGADNSTREFIDSVDNGMMNEPDSVTNDNDQVDMPENPDNVDIPDSAVTGEEVEGAIDAGAGAAVEAGEGAAEAIAVVF